MDRAIAWAFRTVTRRPPSFIPPVPRGPVHSLRRALFQRQLENSPRDLRLLERPRLQRGRGTRLVIGDRTLLGHGVLLYLDRPGSTITIGSDCLINHDTKIVARHRVSIGDDTLVSWNVSICDSDMHELVGSATGSPITIGRHVWIGNGVTILKGVVVGDGAVIAAGSLVTRDVPPATLVTGAPAQVVRTGVTWNRTPEGLEVPEVASLGRVGRTVRPGPSRASRRRTSSVP